jgi:hypothetical protein
MPEKIAVYIVSMGDTPQAIGEFARRFGARFGISEQKVLALSRRLPGRIGSYDIDKARLLGIEIKRMGGQVSLRREAADASRPAPPAPPAAESGGEGWVVHGHAESQDELMNMTRAAPEGDRAAADTPHDSLSPVEGDLPPPPPLPPERKVAGKYEAKEVYTASQATYGLDEEHFKKVKSLYAGRKDKRKVTESPAFRIVLLLLVFATVFYLYTARYSMLKHFAGFESISLTDAYEQRVPPNVPVPSDLTGSYAGDLKYTTRAGDIAFIGVGLTIEGKNIHGVTVDVSSTAVDIGKYQLTIEYTPGFISYSKTANNKEVYRLKRTFPSTDDAVASIDETGWFTFTLDALDVRVDPTTIPESEKDRLGNTVFLKMEGRYAGDGRFVGGLLTSGTPLMGWEAKKK